MPSIFLFAGFIECSSLKLPRPFRRRGAGSKKAKSLESQEPVPMGKGTAMRTVLSGSLTDSTGSLYSQSSCDSTPSVQSLAFQKRTPAVDDLLAFQKRTAVLDTCNGDEAIEVLVPAETFYFMRMEDEQSTASGESWGYFVDVDG